MDPNAAARAERLRQAAEAAAERIWQRRTDCHDPAEGQLPPKTDLFGVADHARRYRRGISPAAIHEDVEDGWIIQAYVAHQLDVLRLGLILTGELAGMTYGDLAPRLGLSGRGAVEKAKRRLEQAVSGQPRDAAKARGPRRAARQAALDAQLAHDRADRLTQVVTSAVNALQAVVAHLPEDARDHLEDLVKDDEASPAATVARLNLIVHAIRKALPGPDLHALAERIHHAIEETLA